jgi:hypothetical protein
MGGRVKLQNAMKEGRAYSQPINTLCNTILSSRLVVSSNPQISSQSVQVNHHCLHPGMMLDFVDCISDLGDYLSNAFPGWLQLRQVPSVPAVQPDLMYFLESS